MLLSQNTGLGANIDHRVFDKSENINCVMLTSFLPVSVLKMSL